MICQMEDLLSAVYALFSFNFCGFIRQKQIGSLVADRFGVIDWIILFWQLYLILDLMFPS